MSGGWVTCSLCAGSYRPADGHHVCPPGRPPGPADLYVAEVRAARQRSTWRLLAAERRLRRAADRLDPPGLARWAAVRRVLAERGVELPDT